MGKMKKKIYNKIRGYFIVENKLLLILILVLQIVCFGLFAGESRFILRLRGILSSEIELINFVSTYILKMCFLFVVLYVKNKNFIFYNKNVIKSKLCLKNKKNSIILKRYYFLSMSVAVNPFMRYKNGNYVTTKTIYNIYKSSVNKSNKGVKFDLYGHEVGRKPLQHYGEINGIKFYNENKVDMDLFTAYTNGDFHEISFDEIELKELQNIGIKELILPTLKVDLEVLNIEENKSLTFPNQSLVKTYLPENLNISLKSNEIKEIDLKKFVEIKQNKGKVMEILDLKDYELIDINKQLYKVPNKDIKKEGEIIVKINLENAEKITVEKAVILGDKIIKNKELENYLNISSKLKETYLKNNYEYIQYNKYIKKD